MLALIGGYRLVVSKQPIDLLTAGLVVVAAVAAIAHRNAVGGLEARGRGEAESFARILRGLSRSVSADAIVAAILDDLIDATAADHVVLVRRRPGSPIARGDARHAPPGHSDDRDDAAASRCSTRRLAKLGIRSASPSGLGRRTARPPRRRPCTR